LRTPNWWQKTEIRRTTHSTNEHTGRYTLCKAWHTNQQSWRLCTSDNQKYSQRYTMAHSCKTSTKGLETKNITKSYIMAHIYLSESKTNCWLSGSCKAFASSRRSALTIDILPHTTCNKVTNY